jgi:gliding motility-associated-like protein
MRKIYAKFSVVLLFLLFSISFSLEAGPSGWAGKYVQQKLFIENRGQFKINMSSDADAKVQYAYDGNHEKIYFTKSGLVFQLIEIKKNIQKESEEKEMKERIAKGITAEEHAEMEREEKHMIVNKDELSAQWIGANADVEIIAEHKSASYYSYSFKDGDGIIKNENEIPAYEKLTYKNLYPDIDVVYEMHPSGGIKYSVVIHPGGDASLVQLRYSKNAHLLANGDIRTRSYFGNFMDHAPVTFYEDKTPIISSYSLKHNIISFALGNYDHSKTIVIDPWTATPSFATQWDCVWECQKDAANNVYIIGGVSPMQLLKYNATGTLQWTYNTPWDTANFWLGTFAVDNAGNSYVTAGSLAQIQKVGTAGALIWSNTSVGGIFSSSEFWSISFNCDQTQLVIGGTGGTLPPLPYIYNMNMSSGNVTNSLQVTGGALFPTQEVRAITACGNGNYYFLTHDSIGYIHQGLTSCLPPGSAYPFHVSSGTNFGYKCENWRENNTGIRALRSFGGYVYMNRGDQLQKRDFNTGAVIASVAIPGGTYAMTFGAGAVSNSGIDIDSCGNIYVGSTASVVKFDNNFNQLATYTTVFNVYDVVVSPNGNVIAAGSTGNQNSGARTGYVQSFSAGACNTIAIVCCDATICPHAAVCATDPAFTLTAATAGGVWSGTGITNTTTGTFNPSVSGVGTFTIYYTLPCGSDSTVITVNNCSATSLCRNSNGTLTVSGGTAPYTWAEWDSTGRTCQGGIVLGNLCFGGTWVATYGWANFATGATITPPVGVDSFKVTDNAGTKIVVVNPASVPPCVTCAMVVSPGLQKNVSCFGGSNGTAYATVVGGTAPYTYTWSPAVSTLDSAVNLAQGTYTVTVHDASGCSCTASFTISQPIALSATNITVPASCGGSNGKVVFTVSGGTPGYTYVWSPNTSSADSAVNLAAGTYHITITDSKGCTFTSSASVGSSAGISVSPGVQKNVSCFGGNNGSAYVTVTGGTAPYTYTWSPAVSTLDSAINLVQGTYAVTVHDASGCTGTTSFTITQPTALSNTNTTVPAACGNSSGRVLISTTGGAPGYTYIWSPNVSTVDSAINLTFGNYLITVTDANHCTATLSANVGTVGGESVSLSSEQDVSCNGGNNGKIYVIVTGGSLPYTYSWSPSISTTDTAVNLAQGTYAVTVHDANNCTSTISVVVNQPAAFVVTDVVTPASCANNNGKVIVNVSGATPAYTYTWSPNVSTVDSAVNLATGSYTVTVKDAHNCTTSITANVTTTTGVASSITSQKDVSCFGGNNGSVVIGATGGVLPYSYTWSPNVSTVDSATNLTAGTYTLTVKDANNCSGVISITITQPASALGVTYSTQPAYCGNSNGKINITASGGTAGYIYIWSPNVSINDSAINLGSGSYLVTVTDANHCTVSLPISVLPVAGPTVSLLSKQDVSCNGGNNGKIYISAGSGSAPYSYLWSPAVSINDSATNLSQGTYNVTVTDAHGCTSSLSVTVNQPAAISVSTTTVSADCGVGNGSATAVVTGSTGNLTFQWSAGSSITAVDSGLAAGSYTVTVTDGNQCTGTGIGAVSNAGGPGASIASQDNVQCNGGNTGKIVLNITGGTLPYTYTWSPNVSSVDSAINLIAGTYNVTVHDASNCIAVVSATITQPQPISATLQSVNADCGQNDGWAKIIVTGGTGTYIYNWSVAQTTDSITALSGGTYYVTVTDSLGCTFTDSVVVGTNNGPAAPSTTAGGPLVFCQGGTVTLTSSAATGNTWSTGATTQSIVVSVSGTYTVIQTVGSCSSSPSASVVVTVNPIPAAPTITASGSLSFCAGSSVTLTSSSVIGNLWSNNETGTSIVVSIPGTYTVSDTQSGCPSPASAPVTVSIISAPLVVIHASQPALCPGSGSVTLDATTTAATSYSWNTTSTQAAITVTAPGFYEVTVNVNGCIGTDTLTITAEPLLGTLSLSDTSVCQGAPVILNATTLNATSYLWSGAINATSPIITVDTAGTYLVQVSNACGSITESATVTSKDCECRIVMPNAFTPNDDGKNDFFGPSYECADVKYLLLRIFNRWGEKLYETTDLNGQWDGRYKGTMQPPGVYVYYLEFIGEENNTEKNFKLMGGFTLIR